jgi:DNA-binding winged helix-turn-helix (wHTH) protein
MNSEIYKFAEFTLNSAKRTLFKEDVEVKLRDKDFDVLLFLIDNAPAPCSFDEIIEGVWEGTNVENSSVEKAIANIRKILADDARNPRFIKTIRTKGYLFFGDVQKIKEGLAEKPVAQSEDFQPEKIEAKAPAQSASHVHISNFQKALLCLGIVIPLMLGLFWWKGVEIWTKVRSEVVFADDFSNQTIDPNRWKTKGKSVKSTEGTIKLSVDETDNPGTLRSKFFAVDPTRTITIESRIKVTFSQNIKDKVYFGGLFGLIPKTTYLEKIDILENTDEANSIFFGVRYMNYDSEYSYQDVSRRTYQQDLKTEGFFLVRNGGRPNTKSEYVEGKISERIEPTWGKWFEQKIVYNPADGQMMYFIDGEKKGEFILGKLQAKDNQIRFEIMPWGWWVNHSIEIDYIKVTQ